jgi:4,5-DOPA dioxygenase extradiol
MEKTSLMPVLFVGHGSPMNAIEDNAWSRSWRDLGARLPRPRAILCVSAHWETRGTYVSAASTPETIHDFYGFPKALFDVRYPAPGDPALARRIAALGEEQSIRLDPSRGLDHGSWSVLRVMHPDADIPVLQLSLDTRQPGTWHYALARRLAPLREEGVLVVASGDIVHNLGMFRFHTREPLDWALRFRDEVNRRIAARDHTALADWETLGRDAGLSIPSPEHYLPLLYALALQRDEDSVSLFNDDVISALSMTSLVIAPTRD